MTKQEIREAWFKEIEAQKEVTNSRCERDIEKYRKGNKKIVLKDKDGKTLANKKVTIHQKSHDFNFGANIFMLDEFSEEKDNIAYRETFKKYFNTATVPFYWEGIEPEEGKTRYGKDSPKVYRRPAPDLCLEYCNENGISPKLHCLFYDKYMAIPDWLPKNDEQKMRELYEKRFCEISERYSGKMMEFEVTNEILCAPYWNDDGGGVSSILSYKKNTVEWAFDLAKKHFPNDKLVINEGNPMLHTIAKEGYFSKYYLQLEKLLAKGTPIDKIGIQNHIFYGATLPDGQQPADDKIPGYSIYFNPASYLEGLDYLAEFGLPLEITELSIPTPGEGEEAELIQADLLEMMYTVFFSIPKMETVMYWNIVDKTGYVGRKGWNEKNCRNGLFHRDFTPKKSAERLYYLMNEKWHTDLELTTDENGEIEFRGFYGDYTAEIDDSAADFGIHKYEDNCTELEI